MVLSLNLNGADYSVSVHEAGHYFMDNISKFLKGAQLVEVKILLERVLSDSAIGRNFPQVALMFNESRRYLPSGVRDDLDIPAIKNIQDAKRASGNYGDSVWVSQARQGPLTGEDGLFGQILDTRLVEDFATRPKSLAKFMPFSGFLKLEEKSLDALAAGDQTWGYVIGELRKKPEQFDVNVWVSIPGKHGKRVGQTPTSFGNDVYGSYWQSLVTFGQSLLADKWRSGDPGAARIISGMTPSQKERFLSSWENLMNQADSEKWAETFALFVSHPETLSSSAAPADKFMGKLREFLAS